jgi:hypothetical protein
VLDGLKIARNINNLQDALEVNDEAISGVGSRLSKGG